MFRQTKIELYKMRKRLRSYLGFGWMILISLLMAYGFSSGPGPDMLAGHATPGQFEVVGTVVNAEFLAYFMMRGALLTFVPLFVCLVTGDLVAGEAADGTLRPLLTRPISRAKVLIAKYIAAVLYTLFLTMSLGAACLTVSMIFLKHGDLLAVESGIAQIPMVEALGRLAVAYAFSALGMLAVGTMAFFLSSMVSNSLAAIGGAMMAMYAMVIMGTIPFFSKVSEYFFTTQMEKIRAQIFTYNIAWHDVAVSAAYLVAYVAIFFAASMVVFTRKDVLA